MKQRVRVVAFTQRRGKILLMRRAMGRELSTPTWEPPFSKITPGEQPEEAAIRLASEQVGAAENAQLLDALTATGLHGSPGNYDLFLIYKVKVTEQTTIKPSGRYDAYRFVTLAEAVNMHLSEQGRAVVRNLWEQEHHPRVGSTARRQYKEARFTVYLDGGSRGNPGPSAAGYYILDEQGKEVERGGEYLGSANSRQAEYMALKLALKRALELGAKSVSFKSDSLMVVSQMNGVYQVKNRDLWELVDDIDAELAKLKSYSFEHISRGANFVADGEANRILDKHWL
ncbi:reverse transcriptase-like protein [Candidatus Saccharibacteria bacterium]|nr:reverse transcriptase-like protein [Candidatus Saccharibacteria bacterium]